MKQIKNIKVKNAYLTAQLHTFFIISIWGMGGGAADGRERYCPAKGASPTHGVGSGYMDAKKPTDTARAYIKKDRDRGAVSAFLFCEVKTACRLMTIIVSAGIISLLSYYRLLFGVCKRCYRVQYK